MQVVTGSHGLAGMRVNAPQALMFEPHHDDAQLVPEQQHLAADPMVVDYNHFSEVTRNSLNLAKPVVLPQSLTALTRGFDGAPVKSSSKTTGFDDLDSLGLLDGLISPRGLSTPQLGFFPGDFKQEAEATTKNTLSVLVPNRTHILSCSSTPSQSPTVASPPRRGTSSSSSSSSSSVSPVPQSIPMEGTTTVGASDVVTSPTTSNGTRKSRRQSTRMRSCRASAAASARKTAAEPIAPVPKSRTSRGPSKVAKAAHARASRTITKYSPLKTKKTKSSAGKKVKSESMATTVITASLAELDKSGALPANHKPARGRGRQLQLAKMSPAQREAEAKARLEKNRQAARGFRARRKDHIQELEDQVLEFETREVQQQATIASLYSEIKQLKSLIQQNNFQR